MLTVKWEGFFLKSHFENSYIKNDWMTKAFRFCVQKQSDCLDCLILSFYIMWLIENGNFFIIKHLLHIESFYLIMKD